MITRRKPLERGKPPKRSMKPIDRGKPPRQRSAKMRVRQAGWAKVLDVYFEKFEGGVAPCQSCGIDMTRKGAQPHHKLRRGAGGSDAPSNLIAICTRCHIGFIHDGGMGAQTEKARERQAALVADPASAEIGGYITWPEHIWEQLHVFINGKGRT